MTDQSSLKQPSKIALAVMFILLVGSLVFYKERMLFIDANAMCFRIINLKTLLIPENRIGCFITEMVPWIGVKLNWSLKAIFIAYSLSFNLFYFIVTWLLIYSFRQYAFAIVMTLYYTLYVSDVYFWTNSEVHQGIAWMFLFFAIMFVLWKNKKNIWLQIPVFLLLGALSIFSHPLIIVSILFLWLFFWLDGSFKVLKLKSFFFFSFLILLIIAVKIYLSLHQSYDTKLLNDSMQNPFKDLVNDFSKSTGYIFYRYTLINYWITIPIFILGIYALIRSRKFLLLGWTIACALGFLMLLSIVFKGFFYPSNTLFYLEGEWMTMAIIVATPFVFYYLPTCNISRSIGLLLFIFLTRFAYIGMSIPKFRNRVVVIENILQKMRDKDLTKLILVKNTFILDKQLMVDFTMPEESISLSKLDGDKPQRTFIWIYPNDLIKNTIIDNDVMLDFFGPIPYQLNPDYFCIDTTKPYSVLTYDELNK